MNRSDTLEKIAPALVKALAKIEGVAKTKANPGFKGSKYATLESVIDASKDHLTEFGLTILQLPGPLVDGVLTLETILLHESGEFISGDFGITLGKQDPQGVGSAISYARRYALMAALNMPAVDDDGEAAHGRYGASGGHSEPVQARPEPKRADPKPPTLAERAERFADKLRHAVDEGQLDKAWGLGKGLCVELDKQDPDLLAYVTKVYADRLPEVARVAA